MGYLYILYSASRDQYYIGACHNLAIRLAQHNAGKAPSTRAGVPWMLILSRQFGTYAEATREERRLKRMKSRVYLINYLEQHLGSEHPD